MVSLEPELRLFKIKEYERGTLLDSNSRKVPGALLGVVNSGRGSNDVFNLRGVTDPLAGDLLRVF